MYPNTSNTTTSSTSTTPKQALAVTGAVLAVTALLASGYLYNAYLTVNKDNYSFIEFDFYRYCPQYSDQQVDYYRVSINSNIVNNQTVLYYCGRAVKDGQSCARSAKTVCTSPGPRFDVQRNRTINVQWINNLQSIPTETGRSQFNPSFCNATSATAPQFCNVNGYTTPAYPQYSCSPTHLIQGTYQNYRITNTLIPTSTHIHGLEVVAMHDGNPTSWWTYNGTRGLGFFPNSQEERLTANAKNSTYINSQMPGTLWYHDHSMHTTQHNVQNGLLGIYIIRDPVIESTLPSGDFEKYFIFTARTENFTNQSPKVSNQTMAQKMTPFRNPSFARVLKCKNTVFTQNVYRLRLLNAFFKSFFTDLRFVVFDKNTTINKNFTVFKQIMNFTIIGTDSAIMRNPQYNIQTVTLASAERLDLLLDFDQPYINVGDIVSLMALSTNPAEKDFPFYVNITIAPKILVVSEVVTEVTKSSDDTFIKVYTSQYIKPEININTITLPNASFENLTTWTSSNSRFRPLIHSSFVNFQLTINSHPMFESAEAQNPIIGSVQDWYLINTMVDLGIPHPIHIHLINFQIMNEYNLIVLNQSGKVCTIYVLDYYSIDQADPSACTKAYPNSFDPYHNSFLENVQGSTPNLFLGCDTNNCKYLQNTISNSIPTWYRSWKEVAIVKAGTALQVRIRWTRTDYNRNVHGYNYFSYSNASIAAAPGYLYHCHFLDHEDNEMMRPIMLQEEGKVTACRTSDYAPVNIRYGN